MTKLHVSDKLSLPLEFVTWKQAILATTGMGKTHLAQVEAEELLEHGQVIVAFDPTDAWWGLRSSADGKHDGYPVTIFGGDHGDLKLDPGAGASIADAVIAERFSCVLCTAHLTEHQELTVVTDFLARLYRKNKQPIHVFVDEADMFAPETPRNKEQIKSTDALRNIVRRSRLKGVGCTLITQRPAELSKGVLSMCELLMVLGMEHNLDIGQVERWVRNKKDPALADELVESLPDLPQGDAWVWARRHRIRHRFRAREKHTFDSGATPKAGQKTRVAKKLAQIDIARLGETIAAAVERQKMDDPAALRKKLAELAAELAKEKGKTVPNKFVDHVIEKPVLNKAMVVSFERSLDRGDKAIANTSAVAERAGEMMKKAAEMIAASGLRIEAELGKLRAAFAAVQGAKVVTSAPRPVQQRATPKITITRSGYDPNAPRVNDPTLEGKAIGGGLRRILIALAQRESSGLTNRQIGIRAGLSSQSGTFSTYLSRARKEGWIADQGEKRHITNAGLEALGPYAPLPTGSEFADYWLGQLKNSGAARILRVLIEAYPTGLDNATIGERAVISHESGTFSTYMSKLRGLELIVGGRGDTSASEELFS